MVKLADEDIKTREVLDWKGLHVFHFIFSSCSQKLRIFLALKGVDYESHEIDLMTNENLKDYFLGINPRGLLPAIVHDGDVHIESNDILTYMESVYPEPRLIPEGAEDKVAALLKHEDDLHLDLRALSFRFVFNPPHDPKSPEELKIYATTGSGTVNGQKDERVGVEIDFWETYADRGITDDVAQAANEIADGQFRPGFLIPVLAASIGAAYIGIWLGDRILPFGRTTVGKATGAALGTLLADVISRKVRS